MVQDWFYDFNILMYDVYKSPWWILCISRFNKPLFTKLLFYPLYCLNIPLISSTGHYDHANAYRGLASSHTNNNDDTISSISEMVIASVNDQYDYSSLSQSLLQEGGDDDRHF